MALEWSYAGLNIFPDQPVLDGVRPTESSDWRMKISVRLQFLLAIALLMASGCSALPGLRVLTGQDSPDALADQVQN
mgnify:CR=1 FL=1